MGGDRRARATLHGLAPARRRRGATARFRSITASCCWGAVDDIGRYVRLTAPAAAVRVHPGALTRCGRQRAARARPHQEARGSCRVGTAVLRSALRSGSTANPRRGGRGARPPPTLLAGDVSAIALMPRLTTSYRRRQLERAAAVAPHAAAGRSTGCSTARRTRCPRWRRRYQLGAVRARQALVEGPRLRPVPPGGGCCWSAARRPRCCWASRCWRPSACAATRGRAPASGAARRPSLQLLVFSLAHSGWVALVGVAAGRSRGLVVAAFAAAAAGIDAWGLLRHRCWARPGSSA